MDVCISISTQILCRYVFTNLSLWEIKTYLSSFSPFSQPYWQILFHVLFVSGINSFNLFCLFSNKQNFPEFGRGLGPSYLLERYNEAHLSAFYLNIFFLFPQLILIYIFSEFFSSKKDDFNLNGKNGYDELVGRISSKTCVLF